MLFRSLWVMMKKEIMRSKLQIPSPDRSDTYMFTQIIDYIPHNEVIESGMDEALESVKSFFDGD